MKSQASLARNATAADTRSGGAGITGEQAAKLGLVGVMNSLKHECKKYGILVNTVAPVALTRMTEDLPFAAMIKEAAPERVSAAVAFLASEACELTGEVIAAGTGYLARVQIMESQGVHLAPVDVTPEAVAANWEKIADMSGARSFDSAAAALAGAFSPN